MTPDILRSDNMVARIVREIAAAAAEEGEATGVIAVGDARAPLFKLLVTGRRLPDGQVEVSLDKMPEPS